MISYVLGSDGIDGENPPTEAVNIEEKWWKDFRTKHWRENYVFSSYDIYEVKSKIAKSPGKGGDGGKGGFGGRAGKAIIIGPGQTPAFVISSIDGIW